MLCTGALAAACGGDDAAPAEGSPTAAGPPSPTQQVTPLDAPPGCRADGTALELTAVNAAWLDEKGRPLREGEACLAVPAHEPFSIRVRNDPEAEATFPSNHNVSIYTDAAASEDLFYGDLVFPGRSVTYRVPPLAAGVYLFRCDTHPNNMWGVLAVE